MNKKLTIALTGALALGMAAPALADVNFSGTLWFQGVSGQWAAPIGSNTDMGDVKSYVNRLRFTMMNKVNDNVFVKWQTEQNITFGEGAGDYNADQATLVTKELYLSVKLPDTALSFKLGTQGITDTALGYTYMLTDATGLVFNYAADAAKVNFGRIQGSQGGKAGGIGDMNIYLAQVAYKAEAVALNFDLYQAVMTPNAKGGTTEDYSTYAVKAATKLSGFDVAAFYGMQTGEEVEGNILDITAKGAFGDVKAGLELISLADDDDATKASWKMVPGTPWLATRGLFFFGYGGQLAGAVVGSHARAADAVARDNGLTAIILNASTKVGDYNVTGVLGNFSAKDEGAMDGTDMGTEIGLGIGRKLADAVDASLNFHYVALGSYYDGTAKDDTGAADDPNDLYALILNLKAGF